MDGIGPASVTEVSFQVDKISHHCKLTHYTCVPVLAMEVLYMYIKGGGSIVLVVRQRILWKPMALARNEIFKFNYIHDYNINIIGHERSSMEQGSNT